MDLKQLSALFDLLADKDVHRFAYEDEAFKVEVTRGADPVVTPVAAVAPVQDASPPPAADPVDDDAGTVTIDAPMPGTFYMASSPGATPFVAVGSTIAPGQTVGIIEAMKLMNGIESEVGGTVVARLVDDGTPVQFGTALFRVRPA